MSEVNKENRLNELMSEFLESNEGGIEKSSSGFDQAGLDNKKMLDAIENHRNEIDVLKGQLAELKDLIKEQSEKEKMAIDQIVAPEITALQTSITKHNIQIGELQDIQKEIKNDVEQKKDFRNEDIEKLKVKVEELKEEVKKKPASIPEKSKARPITPAEIIAVQKSITNQSAKIGDLESKQNILKSDVERVDKKERKGAFGSFGWLLLASNVLLWSVLGFIFWKSNSNSAENIENARASQNIVPAVYDTIEDAQGQDGLVEGSENTPDSAGQIDMTNNSLNSQESSPSINNTASTQRATPVKSRSVARRTAARRAARLKRANRKRVVTTSAKSAVKQESKAAKTVKPKTENQEPAVSFGD